MWSFAVGTNRMVRPKNAINRLFEVADVLLNVSLENLTWQKMLARYDHQNVIFYLDPPYVPSARACGIQYQHEMSEADHADLVAALGDLQAKVLLSGYDNELYNSVLLPPRWRKIKAPRQKVSSGAVFSRNQNKSFRQECCWMNYDNQALSTTRDNPLWTSS